MSGCDFLKKSFQVSVSASTGSDLCSDCGKDGNHDRRINGKLLCRDCFTKRPTKIQPLDLGESFQTSKDKLWEFVDVHTTGKPLQFTSKKAWKDHLKKRGLTDDVDMKKLGTPGKEKKSDYKEVVKQAFKERDKFRQDIKYGRIPCPEKLKKYL